MPRFSAAAAVMLLGAPALAGPPALTFRDQAAEISAASRLVSSYGTVTSTFRTVAHNKAVGGVPDSYHLLDRAIDIARRPGVTHRQIEAALRKAGYSLVESLDEVDHSHFAFAALSSRAPPTPVTPQGGPPPPPPKPLPRVAADEHGTLTLDLQAQARSAASAAVTPQ